MARRVPASGKLARPRLHAAAPRPALFRRFDEALNAHRGLFVVGPPGAGKTTAIASWLDARRIPGIWYQVTTDDADIASLFHYLGEAQSVLAPHRQRKLPTPTADQLKDVGRFGQRFFHELFSRLPRPAVLVLDNYHALPPASELHSLIAGIFDALPEGVADACIGRSELNQDYARPLAHGAIQRIDWHDLRLSPTEAAAIARQRGMSDPRIVQDLHERCDGWAAGFTLLLEQSRHDQASTHGARVRSEVFDYFAAEVFRSLAPGAQEFLLHTAHLPWVTAPIASQLTGAPQASRILTELHRRHLFLHATAGKQPVYRYHGLFRQFLLEHAAASCSPDARRALQRKAADLLLEEDPEHAVELYAQAEEWPLLVRAIVDRAPSLLSQGRWRTVQAWIGRLPEDVLRRSPWARYWFGVGLGAVDVMRGRAELEQAYEVFRQRADVIGQMLCAAEILRAFFIEFRSFERVDPWIDALGQLVQTSSSIGSPEQELRVCSALLGALASRRPAHPMIDHCVRRTRLLLEDQADPNLVLISAISLVFYSSMAGRVRLAEEAAMAVQPHLQAESLSPILKIFWLGSYGYVRYIATCHEEAVELFERAETLAEEHGLKARVNFIRAWHAYCLRRMSDLEAAESLGRQIERCADDAGTRRNVMWLRALIERSKGNLLVAVQLGAEALGGLRQSECTLHGAQHLQQAEMCLEAGMLALCRDWLEEAKRRIVGTFSEPAWTAVVLMLEALLALRAEDIHGCTERLRRLLALARHDEAGVFLPWFPYGLSQLLPIALELGVERDVARALVRRLRLAPARPRVPHWPWQVRIYTLGEFRVTVDDQPLRYPRKTPRRLLLLLKLLVAAAGRPVPMHRLIDTLYPNELGDASAHALDAATHRLRRLLGSSDAVRASDGHLSLDETLVWTDVAEFDRLLSASEQHPRWTEEALMLYRGDFLPDESDAPWAISLRERLRGKLLYHVERCGLSLEESGQWQQATAVYLQGIDADPLSEACYQGLMRSYAAQDRRAEALSAYRRLRQQLSIVLGIGPSRGTEALAQAIREPLGYRA